MLFLLTLGLLISVFISASSTVVGVTLAANLVHSLVGGITSMAQGGTLAAAIHELHPAAHNIAQHVDSISQAQWLATEKTVSCDDNKTTCRAAKLALHSAKMGGILTRDAIVNGVKHAPEAWKYAALPALEFSKQQGMLLFEQLKGLGTSEGRESVKISINGSVKEVQQLTKDLYEWIHCVFQRLHQSGWHSLSHWVHPAGGCWQEAMSRYLVNVDGDDAAGTAGSKSNLPGQQSTWNGLLEEEPEDKHEENLQDVDKTRLPGSNTDDGSDLLEDSDDPIVPPIDIAENLNTTSGAGGNSSSWKNGTEEVESNSNENEGTNDNNDDSISSDDSSLGTAAEGGSDDVEIDGGEQQEEVAEDGGPWSSDQRKEIADELLLTPEGSIPPVEGTTDGENDPNAASEDGYGITDGYDSNGNVIPQEYADEEFVPGEDQGQVEDDGGYFSDGSGEEEVEVEQELEAEKQQEEVEQGHVLDGDDGVVAEQEEEVEQPIIPVEDSKEEVEEVADEPVEKKEIEKGEQPSEPVAVDAEKTSESDDVSVDTESTLLEEPSAVADIDVESKVTGEGEVDNGVDKEQPSIEHETTTTSVEEVPQEAVNKSDEDQDQGKKADEDEVVKRDLIAEAIIASESPTKDQVPSVQKPPSEPLWAPLVARLSTFKSKAGAASGEIFNKAGEYTDLARTSFENNKSSVLVGLLIVGATTGSFLLGTAVAGRNAGGGNVIPRADREIEPAESTVWMSARSVFVRGESSDGESVEKPKRQRRGPRQSAPARLAPLAEIEDEEEEEEEEHEEEEAPTTTRGRRTTRGATKSPTKSRVGTASKTTRKVSVSRRTSRATSAGDMD